MKRMYKGCWLLTVLLAAMFTVLPASQASAQQRQTPQPGDVPVPDKVFGWYEDQRIFVQAEIVNTNLQPDEFDEAAGQTYRIGERFGNRIGNLIPVRFRIYLVKPAAGQREIEVEFAPLKSSPPRLTIVNFENQDWWVASKDALQKGEEPISIKEFPNAKLDWGGQIYDCSKMIQINMIAQTFKDPRYRINLWLEFTYAAKDLAGGGLDWKPLETPDYWVDLSATADPGNDLSLGNTNPVSQPRPVSLAATLIVGGLFLVLSVLCYIVARWLRRNFGGHNTLDDQERLWQTVEPVLTRTKVQVDGAGEAYALTRADILIIIEAVHTFINASEEQMLDISAWTLEELRERQLEIKDGRRWTHVLEPLRGVLQQDTKSAITLSADRFGRIVTMLREICPKP